jgi:hypothetical protein
VDEQPGGMSCRALNRTTVEDYFKLLNEVIERYDIHYKNIYNMDEKGIQLGVGVKSRVLVDRDQKNVQKIENGNRDLVTIMECMCADGTALHPSVVFQGARRDLKWGENNPCNARYLLCYFLYFPALMLELAYRSPRTGGRTRNSARSGLKKILLQRQRHVWKILAITAC